MRSSLPGTAISGELKRGESVLGRCVVDRRLRRDRLTAVYLARGREPGEAFSVWTVHSAVVARSERAAHVFGLEMERLSLMELPGIPQIVAFDAAESGPVVISARRPGSTLREIIASGSDRSAKLCAEVLQGLARILELLHTQTVPVLHRGLVPERVVLDEEGEVHLEECGYLHALVTAGFITDRTVLACGQPGYLLPEELAFPPTAALDVFSLATMLFELLTGRLPFGELSAAELAVALRADQLPLVSRHRADLSMGVDAVFERAFGVAQGEGYPTVHAFARDLLRALEPDVSARLTLPGSEAPSDGFRDEVGPNLSISVDPEPTPSYGDYGAMLAQLDARRAGASPLPEVRELAPPVSVVIVDDRNAEASSPPLPSSKRTLPGGTFALAPTALAKIEAAPAEGRWAQPVVTAARAPRALAATLVYAEPEAESDAERISADALQSIDGDALDLSLRDLQPAVEAVREDARRRDLLLADQPTKVSPAPANVRPSSAPASRATPAPRALDSSPAASHNSRPSDPFTPSHLPAPGRIPADLARLRPPSTPSPSTSAPSSSIPVRPASRPPSLAPPDASLLFVQAARLLSVSTVIAAVCVTTGLLYIARASDDLRASLRAARSAPPALEIPPPTPVADTGPTAVVEPPVAALDAGVAATPPPAAAPDAAVATAPPAVAAPRAVPGPATVTRLMASLRGPVADCVEGVEVRSVTLWPRFDGATGAVVHLRLRGLFTEAPMAPCLDEAVRRVRVAPFPAPSWEPALTFPIAPPRWAPASER